MCFLWRHLGWRCQEEAPSVYWRHLFFECFHLQNRTLFALLTWIVWLQSTPLWNVKNAIYVFWKKKPATNHSPSTLKLCAHDAPLTLLDLVHIVGLGNGWKCPMVLSNKLLTEGLRMYLCEALKTRKYPAWKGPLKVQWAIQWPRFSTRKENGCECKWIQSPRSWCGQWNKGRKQFLKKEVKYSRKMIYSETETGRGMKWEMRGVGLRAGVPWGAEPVCGELIQPALCTLAKSALTTKLRRWSGGDLVFQALIPPLPRLPLPTFFVSLVGNCGSGCFA